MIAGFYELLKKYNNLERSSFHTPGHKCRKFQSEDLLSLDLTELPMTDSLYEACGAIKLAEDSVAKLYGAKKTLFSCGGNTLCIQAMFRLALPNGGKVLCDRVVHRSAVGAMALLGIEPIWVTRDFDKHSRLYGLINTKKIVQILKEEPEIKAVYLTSPDYYGILQDIKSISDICNDYNIPVLVDNAHGAHLMFADKNLHPLNQGAALVADSAHKTLPVLTGGAWLHINDERFVENSKNAMALFGSTSPFYPTMASMDLCRAWLEDCGEQEFALLKEFVDKIKAMAYSKGLFLPKLPQDPVRITLGVSKIGYTGYEFRELLYKFNIEPEFCDKNYVVLIPTPLNSEKDRKRLEDAILSVKPRERQIDQSGESSFSLPAKKTSLRDAVTLPAVCINTEESNGRISARIACPCPPGVPIVMPGEVIGDDHIKALKDYGIFEIFVLR